MADKVPFAAGSGPMLVKPATWEALRQRVEDLELIPDTKDFDVSTRGGKKFIRLRGMPGAVRPGPPPIPALTLSAGKDGARIYQGVLEWAVTTLRFERKTIEDLGGNELDKVNSFNGQDAIAGVEVMKREDAESADDDGWWDLDWWGNVWAKVILDPETGEPVSWDIVGPEEPEMREIPELNDELGRESEGGGEGGETGFATLIGNVPEEGIIKQERTGNLQWFCAFVPEAESSSDSSDSSSGSSGSSSDSGSVGPSGSGSVGPSDNGSDKSTAIVPMPWHEAGYGAMFTMESNQVLFEFVAWDIPIRGRRTRIKIDARMLFVCEPDSIRVCGMPCGELPYPVGATVEKGVLTLTGLALKCLRPRKVCFKLTGVRKGFDGYDMPARTHDQFLANEEFINSAYPKS